MNGKNILTFQIPNGENNKSFLLRLKNFVSDLKKQKDVLIVAHAGSINGMISILTGQPFDKLLKKLLGKNYAWFIIFSGVKRRNSKN